MTDTHAETGLSTVPTSPSLSSAAPSSGPSPSPQSTTWYVHRQRTCEGGTENFCNCGSYRNYLFPSAAEDQCDGGGCGVPSSAGFCDGDETFPSDRPFPSYARGASVNGTLYLTSDAVEIMNVRVRLEVRGEAVGEATVSNVTVVGYGGAQAQAVPFAFQTTAPIDNATALGDVSFVLHVEALQSWFLASTPPSGFTICCG
jgi:hypothetical protein